MQAAASPEGGTWRLRAHAKLNLFLKVHPLLASGMHPIEGVFASITLADELTVSTRPTPGITFSSEFDFDGPAEENLCVRAARAFLERAGLGRTGAEIRLDKQIPTFAGLGGGSADAAAVLLALARAYPGVAGNAALAELGAGLGSDVPFCLQGGLALVRGTGAELERVRAQGHLHVLLVKPPCAVATARAYRAFDEFPNKAPEGDLEGLLAALAAGDARAAASKLYNSFATVVEAEYPAVRHAREQLTWAGALGAQLSGSGAAVYGIFPDEPSCREAREKLGGRYPTWQCTLSPRGVDFLGEEDGRR